MATRAEGKALTGRLAAGGVAAGAEASFGVVGARLGAGTALGGALWAGV